MSGLGPFPLLPAEKDPSSYTGPTAPAHPLAGTPADPHGAAPLPFLGQGEEGSLMPLNASSLALGNSLVVKVGQGWLLGLTARSGKASAQFIQVFDTSSGVPGNGAIPQVVFDVGATSTLTVGYLPCVVPFAPGRLFFQGIVVCNSSTAATLTIGAADTFFDVQYV